MAIELLYATNNPGKILEVTKHLVHQGIEVKSPKDLKINKDVPETGQTLEENAVLKIKGFRRFRKRVGDRLIVSDDTGLEIDALNKKPGIHVRRWRDGETRMTDEEIIDYCMAQMTGIPADQRGAQFRTVLAIGLPDGSIETYDGILRGTILEKPADIRIEGFPFESLFYVTEWGILLGEAHKLTADKKDGRLNHRERALEKAIPRIRELLS